MILEILADRPVAYHPRMAKAVGGVKQAIFVCQFLYWNGKGKKKDGWIFKKQADIEEETGLTRREQETVRTHLKKSGILEEELHGVPATMHYRLNVDVLLSQIAQAYQSSLHEPAKLDCTNPPNLNGASVQSIPESTPKTTQKKTNKGSPDGAPPPHVPTSQQQMVEVLSQITGMDYHLKSNASRLGKAASELIKGQYEPRHVKAFGQYWQREDWRGKKGDAPKLSHILEGIGQVRNGIVRTLGHEPTEAELEATRAAIRKAKAQPRVPDEELF